MRQTLSMLASATVGVTGYVLAVLLPDSDAPVWAHKLVPAAMFLLGAGYVGILGWIGKNYARR